jgi:hypothetical protein
LLPRELIRSYLGKRSFYGEEPRARRRGRRRQRRWRRRGMQQGRR